MQFLEISARRWCRAKLRPVIGVREAQVEVPPSLARWVATVSELRDVSERNESFVRLPDAMSSLVICEAAHGVKIVAVGPIRRAFYKSSASLDRYTRITFHPGRARLALGAAPHELTGGIVDLGTLWGKSARPVFDAVAGARNSRSQSVVEAVAPVLSRRFENASSIASDVVRRAAFVFENADGADFPRVQMIAKRLHVSERFLRNAFHDEMGVSPKRFARIARIRRVAVAATTDATPWATLATKYGFFDQAHLSAEFRDLLRVTPAAFRAGDIPRSSGCGAA